MNVHAALSEGDLADLLGQIGRCRICLEAPRGRPLPHAPRPVVRATASARLLIAGQAPGLRVHESGLPFTDPSGDRLRAWMGIDADTFYDARRIAIVPMGFCFPGYDAKKSDLPPRPECRAAWHDRLMSAMPAIETILAIGTHAQDYHFERFGLPPRRGRRLEDIVREGWRQAPGGRRILALPHPSWRNSGWLKRSSWFEAEILPLLRDEVARLV